VKLLSQHTQQNTVTFAANNGPCSSHSYHSRVTDDDVHWAWFVRWQCIEKTHTHTHKIPNIASIVGYRRTESYSKIIVILVG